MVGRMLAGLLVLVAAAGVVGGILVTKDSGSATSATPAGPTPSPTRSPAATPASAPTTAATPDPSPVTTPDPATSTTLPFVGFVDDSSQATLQVGLDPSSSEYGSVWFAEPGIGIVSTRRPAAVDEGGPGPVAVTYDGPGSVNRRAKIDPELAVLTLPRGPIRRAHVRVSARLQPSNQTGVLDLWVDNKHLHLTFGQPPTDADPVVRAVVRAMRAEDFAALYDLADSGMRHGLSRAAFVAQTKKLATGATLTAVRETGPVSYLTTATGVHYAYAPIAAVISQGGVRQHLRQQIVLVREDGTWRFTTTRDTPAG